jgi:dihydroorotase-like cyclic amidohydrolase
MLDLKVVNGTLFIPGVGLVKSGVGVQGGKIAMIAADDLLPEAKEVIDAGGHFVIPGCIDPHVHIGIFSTYEGEIETETRYALSGGITTIGVFMGGADSYMGILPGAISTGESLSSTDFMFHLSIFTPQQMEEMDAYYSQFGVTDFKFYMTGVKGIFPNVPDDFIRSGFRKIASMGAPAIGCVHCEDQEQVDQGWEEIGKIGSPTLKDWENSSPAGAEADAARRFVNIARETGARSYMVHMSSREAAEVLAEMFKDGRDNIYVETTSAYCGMTSDDPMGKLAKMLPPIRGNDAQEAMWKAVKSGVVSTFGTDNVSCATAHKGDSFQTALPGYPVIGTHIPLLLTEGYHKRGIPWTTIIEKATKTPAEAFGIYPRKGTIAVGSDADLVILDLNKEEVVDPSTHYSFSDFSLFQGRKLKGWPVRVIKGGQVAVAEGKVLSSPGIGKYLRREIKK